MINFITTKTSKILVLIFFCSVAPLNKIFAQKTGYVITKANDTIFCQLKAEFLSGVLRYRATKRDTFVKINSKDITQVFFANDSAFYVFRKLPENVHRFGRSAWLQLLEKGRINLYVQQVKGGTDGRTCPLWYASKGNDSLRLIKIGSFLLTGLIISVDQTRKERENAFMDLISDFPDLLKKFKKQDYSFNNIEECIATYNTNYLHQ